MYKNGGYAGDDRMCDLVCDRYAVLQVMSRFGIALGFGDKTIAEVCAESRVDAATFLAVVNMLMNFGNGAELAGEVSVRSLTDYLHNSHGYFLDFRLPAIRRKLIEAVDCALSDVSFAIMRFFDEYAAEVQRHMSYEEQTVFPYVESLLSGEKNTAYSIDIFRRQHDQVDAKLRELKNIIIKYYPSGSSNELNGVLFDIFNCEHELASHNAVARGLAERNAVNAPIQGSAADIMKIAMINVHRRFAAEGIRSRVILQVHDELVVDMLRSEQERVTAIVTECMESAAQLKVRLIADAGVGGNWLEAH